MAINLDAPMSWREFKNLEKGEQCEYLQHLIDTYGANAVSFAQMFGISAQTMRKYIASDLGIALSRGSRVDKASWYGFLRIPASAEETAGGADTAMHIHSATMRFEGKIDMETIAAELKRVFDGNTLGQIEISFTVGAKAGE